MDLIEKLLQKLLDKACCLYALNLEISIKIDLKGHRLIGQCKKISEKRYVIRLHKKLLEEYQKRYLDDVLTHEFAHAIQMELFKKSKPHSKEWKNIVEILSGVKNQEKINYNLEKTKKYKMYPYKCLCKEHYLSSIRHNKITRKIMIYKCTKCHETLRFLDS